MPDWAKRSSVALRIEVFPKRRGPMKKSLPRLVMTRAIVSSSASRSTSSLAPSSRPNSKGLRGAGGRALAINQSRVGRVTQHGLRIMRNTSSGVGPRRASWGMRSKLLMGLVLLAGCRGTPGKTAPRTYVPHLIPQESGTRFRLQAVSVVDEKVVWASGAGGTYVRTIDGGNTWTA